MKVKGIDISKWQGNIDFDLVRKNGISFCIIRAGSGRKVDPYFERNYTLAKRAGLQVGVYWYSYAKSSADAIAEANLCLSVLQGKQLEFPVYMDVEEKEQFNRGAKFVNDIIYYFGETVEKAGFYFGIYMSKSFAQKYLYDNTLARFDLWIAQYNNKCTYTEKYSVWQYSSTGKINGIQGNVDLDYCYTDYAKIMKKAGLNGYGKK